MAPTAAVYRKSSVDCFGSQKGVTFKTCTAKLFFHIRSEVKMNGSRIYMDIRTGEILSSI